MKLKFVLVLSRLLTLAIFSLPFIGSVFAFSHKVNFSFVDVALLLRCFCPEFFFNAGYGVNFFSHPVEC